MRLVTVAHGTRHATGNFVARSITAQAGRRLGGVSSTTSYVELCSPLFSRVMGETEEPVAVVPLLLSTGYHIRHDLPSALAPGAVMGAPLGPHPLLAEVMCHRLRGSGARRGDPVVLVATGSNDPLSLRDVAMAGRLLQARWGAPVRISTLSGLGPRPIEVINAMKPLGEVAVAPYLLAPGHFLDRTAAMARCAGITRVAGAIGDHPLVAELVARHYRALVAPLVAA